MNKLKRLINKLWRAFLIALLIRKARRIEKTLKTKVFVVIWGGRPRIVTSQTFKWLRQHGVISKAKTMTDLKNVSIYYTGKDDKKRVQRPA